LIPAVTSKPKAVAALVGGSVAVAGDVFAVPLDLGLILGGLAGVVAGVLAAEWLSTPNDGSDVGGGH
jgi:hypothetical protein